VAGRGSRGRLHCHVDHFLNHLVLSMVVVTVVVVMVVTMIMVVLLAVAEVMIGGDETWCHW